MASETLYCMECVEGWPVALGLCADCLAGEPVGAVVGQIARLARELEAARERERRIIEVLERSACHDLTARDALDGARRALAADTEASDGE